MKLEMIDSDREELLDDEFLFHSHLYSSITVVFAMAVLSKFFSNDIQFGFRGFLTLVVVFIGEPLCHFFLRGPTGVVVFGLGCLAVYSILPASHLPAARKPVLITGCDSGFGQALARELDSIGARVFAGCLCTSSHGAKELLSSCSERLKLVQLDVTDEKQVADAYDFVESHVGTEGLWGIVNNAGIVYLAELEMTSVKLFRKVLDVNLLGVINVTKTFLPLVRLAKGRIVNMSSITGRIPAEHMGSYAVSKSGIEMYSDILRLEMKKWDVRVSVVEPQRYRIACSSPEVIAACKAEVWSLLDEKSKAVYGSAYLERLYSKFETRAQSFPSDLSPVVAAMHCALFSKRPKSRYVVGRGMTALTYLFAILPSWISDQLSLAMSGRDVCPAMLQQQTASAADVASGAGQ